MILAVALLYAINGFAQTNAENGKAIFSTRCASCHNVKVQVVGPALRDVTQRHTEAWLIKFIHSSQTLIKSGDTQAVRLFSQYNQVVMPDHPDLKDEDIKSIMAYVDSESVNIAKTANLHPRPPEQKGPERPVLLNDYYTLSAYAFFLVLLLLGMNALMNGINAKNTFYAKKE